MSSAYDNELASQIAALGVPCLVMPLATATKVFGRGKRRKIRKMVEGGAEAPEIFKAILGESLIGAKALYRLIAHFRTNRALETEKREVATASKRASVLEPVGKPCAPVPPPYYSYAYAPA